MGDEGMHDSQMRVDIPDVIYKNDTSQNNNGSGSMALSTDVIMGIGLNMQRASDLLFGFSIYAEPTKTKIIGYSCSAMDELSKIGIAGKPLWQPQTNNRYEILNDIEYLRQFGQVDTTLREIVKLIEVGEPQNLPSFDSYLTEQPTLKTTPRVALQTESSRDMAYIKMTPISIVELLMDVNQWSSVFYNIVSKATIVGTLLGVEGSYDDKLHVMSAELHLPTPVVPTRECYFGRYSKQLSHNKWGVVDVSLDKFISSPTSNFLKRPSGCLITGMPNGYSKVVWVEHVEVDHSDLDNYSQQLDNSTLAFCATRWLNSLVRYSEWSQTLKATTFVADEGVRIPQTGRTSFLKLADRMMRIFCANISATTDNPWMQIPTYPGSKEVRVMVQNNMEDTATPPGTSVVFTTSLWLEVSPNRLFNFLRHENSRTKWDSLSRRLTIREFASMLKGENPGNRVSLMRANTSQGELVIFYLQESYTDSTGSYVVYAPLDELAVSALANGSDPDKVMILPSGFSILPGRLPGEEDRGTASFLTVAFNIVESATSRPVIPPESVETIYKIITDTVSSIKDTVLFHNHRNYWTED
ncbi:Homeobox-leucine zipper protein HDG2 [Spatholobus suberectus]|nr:Homeobox-leucine zipper protein HDG2 [Spatholobus suberectus]